MLCLSSHMNHESTYMVQELITNVYTCVRICIRYDLLIRITDKDYFFCIRKHNIKLDTLVSENIERLAFSGRRKTRVDTYVCDFVNICDHIRMFRE